MHEPWGMRWSLMGFACIGHIWDDAFDLFRRRWSAEGRASSEIRSQLNDEGRRPKPLCFLRFDFKVLLTTTLAEKSMFLLDFLSSASAIMRSKRILHECGYRYGTTLVRLIGFRKMTGRPEGNKEVWNFEGRKCLPRRYGTCTYYAATHQCQRQAPALDIWRSLVAFAYQPLQWRIRE